MKRTLFRSTIATALLVLLCGSSMHAQPLSGDPGWPRFYSNGTANVVVYQPQVDRWESFRNLTGRCAFALTPTRNAQPVYGTFHFRAETLVDADNKLVLLRNVRVEDLRFPSVPGGTSANGTDLMRQLLPSDAVVLSLDRVLAFVTAGEVPRQEANVLTTPPPIFVSTEPAVLVVIDGDPLMLDIEDSRLQRVLNTNWELYRDRDSGSFYLHQEKIWLQSAKLDGPYSGAAALPAGLPDSEAVAPSPMRPPRVIVVQQPSELVVIEGTPKLELIDGTGLLVVQNTDSDLFFHSASRSYYLLASGRWFRAASLDGSWTYASNDLPPDFKNIPATHARAHVLASEPGTREAEDAVLLASIPRMATVSRAEAKAEVQYVGSPEFTVIPGTVVSYATNTPNDVLRVGNRYYLCFQGVWFESANATGPWQAVDEVPTEIYAIPESSPKYHVTYVRIYESTPTTVVYGYTPGYYGAYVFNGTVVWGTGYYYAPYVAVGVAPHPVYWGAPYYTYGASVWYNPATSLYTRGAAVYGPYGGYGASAAYNPRTGTYAQGAAVWGPNGGAAAARTYNPVTGTYSAGYRASNPYGSWGEGVVGNGDKWASGGYASNSRGTIAAGQTSEGGRGVAVQGANGNSAYAGRNSSGDVYAGANGNVYKRDNGQWYRHDNGSWNTVDRGNAQTQMKNQAAARDLGNRNAQASQRLQNRTPPAGQGMQQRPQFQGPQFQGPRRR